MRSALWLRSKLSKILLQEPIILSHTPPKCDAWGGLKIHFVALSCKYWATGPCSTNDTSILSSLDAPTKFVPLSLLKMETGPRIAIKRLRALMKEALESSSITSMCTPLVTKAREKNSPSFLVRNSSSGAPGDDLPRPECVNTYMTEGRSRL